MATTTNENPAASRVRGGDPLGDRLIRIWSLAQHIYAQRPDVQEVCPDPRSEEFWIWMNCFGLREYPEIRDLLVPLPPPQMRALAGDGREAAFLLTGASIYRLLIKVTHEVKRPFSSFAQVLDFGCGPARGLRYLLKHAQTLACTGTDVDATAINWCRNHFPFGEFWVNREVPPTDFPSATFDLIYAISVFSHLAEGNHLAWLKELHRLGKSDGIVVLTVHGEHALRRALNEAELFRILQALLQLTKADLLGIGQRLASHQYAFMRQRGGHLNTDLYGVTFISKEYVLRRWSQDFEVLAYLEGAIDNWQDAVVLRVR